MCVSGRADGTERQQEGTTKGYKVYLKAKETKVLSTESYTNQETTEHTPNRRCNFQAPAEASEGACLQIQIHDRGNEKPNLG